MRKAIILFSAFVFYLIFSTPVFADVVLNDSFTDTTQVDLDKTTAGVDTTNHYVELPEQSLASAVDMLQNGLGYAVASKSGITLYELDDATGKIAANPVYSCPWVTDATGVSMRQDNLNVWTISNSSVAYYKYNGAGMSNDPALKVTGLTNVLSVAAFKNKDSALVLQKVDGQEKITKYNVGATLTPSVVFQPNINDPVSISMVNNSPDFRLFTDSTAYYFSYDDATNTYVEDPARKITGLNNVLSASSDNTGNSILSKTDLSYYMNNDVGGGTRLDVYSPGPVSNPVATSLKPGTYEQAFLDSSGNVQWWSYDDAAGKMVRDPNLEVAGLSLNSGYAHPKSYYSKVETTPYACTAAYLTVSDNKPAGTSINYYVSSDGGSTFTAITPGTWTAVPAGTNFVLRADLDTTDNQQTPRIYSVSLNCDVDFQVNGFIDPQPAERGRNVTISANATKLSSGQAVTLDSCSLEYPLPTYANDDPALPSGDTPTTVSMVFNPISGNWEYTFTVPDRTVDDLWPDDGVYQLEIAGLKDGVSKGITLNFEIRGNILRRIIIKTLEL